MTTLRVAFRNISRQKKRSFLLGGAIAFGIMIITLFNSFTAGMVENIKQTFSQILAGHIYIQGRELTESEKTLNVIRDDSLLLQLVEELNLDVKYITRRSNAISTLIFGSKEMMQLIEGVDWDEEAYFKERLLLKEGDLSGLDDPQAIILASGTAEKLGVQRGETILARIRTITGQQNVGEFRVIALSQSTDIIGDLSAYVHMDYLNQLINLKPGEFQNFNIFLNNMQKMDSQAELLYNALAQKAPVYARGEDEEQSQEVNEEEQVSGQGQQMMGSMFGFAMGGEEEETWQGTKYKLSTLNDMMSHIMAAVDVLNIVGFVVFMILLIITMVGITNTFRMILVERTREIGTVRALGMQREGVRNIFLLEALYISLFGALLGLVLAFMVMGILSAISFGTNHPFFIFLNNGYPTFILGAGSILANILLIACISLLAAYFPARKAARLDPAQALGTHY
jgi:putative ABC transport system permease protein